MIEDIVKEIVVSIRSSDLVVFCGAGISRNSGLPLANELTCAILEKLPINEVDENEIMNSDLPFEAFIEYVSESSDISNILNIFEDGKPNTNHILIAKLAKYGYLKKIFTTNFDLLIEKALEFEGLIKNRDFEVHFDEKDFPDLDLNNKDSKVLIFKIHGSVENKNSIRTTIKSVSNRNLSEKRMNVIRDIFLTGEHKAVLILGYSCSDVFDLIPQIQGLEGKRKEIFLINHSTSEDKEVIKRNNFKSPFNNFNGISIHTDTDKLIKKIWNSLEQIINSKYKLYKFEPKWKKHIHYWVNQFSNNQSFIKYFIVGTLFYSISNLKKANEYLNYSLEKAKKVQDERGIADCYKLLGDSYYGLGNFSAAMTNYNRSIIIARELDDKTLQSRCLNGMGDAYSRTGNFVKAIECHKKSIRIVLIIGDKDTEAESYSNLGFAYYSIDNFDKALDCYMNSLKISQEIGSKPIESRSYANLGMANRRLENYDKAVEYQEAALKIAKELGDKAQVSTCYSNLGVVWRRMGELKKSILYHKQALKNAREIENLALVAACYSNLGTAYFVLEDFKKSIKCYLNAERLHKDLEQDHYLKHIYDKLSIAFEKIQDFDNVKKYKELSNMS